MTCMHRRVPALLVVIAAGLASAPAAWAQNALGDGTALDRNLMRGSNGKNGRVRDLQAQINFNNAIVSGNAPFGRSIKGSGQYRSPGEYSGSAGSNAMFRFERDSYASGLAGSGVRGTDALRYQFALSTGTYVPQILGDVGAVTVRRTGQGQGSIPASSSLRSTSDYLAAQALRPSLAGYKKTKDGSLYTATASPLTGVGWQKVPGLGADLGTKNINAMPAEDAPSTQIPGQPARPGENVPSYLTPTQTEAEKARAARGSATLTGMEPGAAGLPGSLNTSALLGGQPQDLRVRSRSEEHDRLVRAIDTAYNPNAAREPEGTPGDAKPETGTRPPSEWENELQEIRKRLSPDAWMIKPKLGPGEAPTRAPFNPATSPVAPALEKPAKPENGAKPAVEPAPGSDPGLEYAAQALGVDVKTMRALRDAGVRFERLSDPKLADQPSYRRHMAAGEQLLATGKFFDAEDRFLRAMAALPGDPMAQVGRLHAQLGAGLFLSAALNLRQIFAEHPEMVVAKYGAALRPDDERAAKIATTLREEMAAKESSLGRDSSLLLAYLGHITDNAEMAKEGLKSLKERTPDDDQRDKALIALLEGVWGGDGKK